jgi:hypothetical protein
MKKVWFLFAMLLLATFAMTAENRINSPPTFPMEISMDMDTPMAAASIVLIPSLDILFWYSLGAIYARQVEVSEADIGELFILVKNKMILNYLPADKIQNDVKPVLPQMILIAANNSPVRCDSHWEPG